MIDEDYCNDGMAPMMTSQSTGWCRIDSSDMSDKRQLMNRFALTSDSVQINIQY